MLDKGEGTDADGTSTSLSTLRPPRLASLWLWTLLSPLGAWAARLRVLARWPRLQAEQTQLSGVFTTPASPSLPQLDLNQEQGNFQVKYFS